MESQFNTDSQAVLGERLSLQARDALGYSIAEAFGLPERCEEECQHLNPQGAYPGADD